MHQGGMHQGGTRTRAGKGLLTSFQCRFFRFSLALITSSGQWPTLQIATVRPDCEPGSRCSRSADAKFRVESKFRDATARAANRRKPRCSSG